MEFALASGAIFLTGCEVGGHFWSLGPDFGRALGLVRSWLMPSACSEPIKEALLEVRRKSYILCARFFVHVMAATILFLLKIYVDKPIPAHLISLVVPSMVYLQHFAVASGLLKPKGVRHLALMNYLQFAALPLLDSVLKVPDSMITQHFVIANRFCLTTVFMDTKLTAVGQFLFLISNLCSLHLAGGELLGRNLLEELQLFTANVGISAVLESQIISRIQASQDSVVTESLLGSFQRMLRGVCDGEVLLDHGLRVQGKAECLKHLLMNTSAMTGTDFLELLMPEERERFGAFIGAAAMAATEAPPCLRVSLRSATGARVAVDLFHVPVPQIAGAEHHLLAIREDAESRRPMEAEVVEDSPMTVSGTSVRSARSSQSSSSASSFQMHELSQVMLMVAATPQLELKQVHMSFQPMGKTLRDLMRPTDWEPVRTAIGRYLQEPRPQDMEPLRLRRLRLRMGDNTKEYFLADRAEVALNGEQLVVHLEDFTKKTKKFQPMAPSLQGISEVPPEENPSFGSIPGRFCGGNPFHRPRL